MMILKKIDVCWSSKVLIVKLYIAIFYTLLVIVPKIVI